jgi:hypothetical protein
MLPTPDHRPVVRTGEASGQEETVYLIVRHLAANQRGVEMVGDRSKPGSLLITAS